MSFSFFRKKPIQKPPQKNSFLQPSLQVEILESREVPAASLSKIAVELRPGTVLPSNKWGLAASAIQATPFPNIYQIQTSSASISTFLSKIKNDARVLTASSPNLISIGLTPNDPGLTSGSMWGLNGAFGINAPSAWDVQTGSTSVTVGIIDTGIDVTHPDLYKNIWVNQGEIPASIKAAIQSNSGWDVDGDGLITFWDLNSPINQGSGKITDLDNDGKITAKDLLYTTSQGDGPTAPPMTAMVLWTI